MLRKTTREEVEKFVKENLVTANDRHMACGDGRYEPEQSEGAIRVFGADFGMVMAFAGALKDEGTYLDPEEIVERYIRAKRKEFGADATLDYHTDTHASKEGGIGCGHIAKALDPSHDGLYGSLTYENIKVLYKAFSKHPDSHLTVLKGPHQEKGVLLVRGASDSHEVRYSVHSKDRKGNMYFVVDEGRIEKFIDRIVSDFSIGLEDLVNAEDVKRNYSLQMQATVKLLGADKLDRHRIAVNEKGHFTMEQLPKRKPKTSNR